MKLKEIMANGDTKDILNYFRNENFIASDVPAILEHTREVYYLGEKELAVLYSDHVDLFDFEGNKIIKEPSHIDWDEKAAEKNGYPHFMIKEIHEQPKGLTDTMRPRIIHDGSGNCLQAKSRLLGITSL